MAATVAPVIPRHPTTFDKVHKASAAAAQPAPTSRPPTVPAKSSSDPYYGHEPTAKLCCRFVTHLFACPDYPPQSSAQPAPPSPPLAQFIAYALHRTRLHESVTFAALYLLQRLKQRFPAARGSSGHRLFLSAFMIASKVICDDTYSNKSWCIVGQGMFALREVNQMEREMCAYLDWELNVDPAALREFELAIRAGFSGPGPYHAVALPMPTSAKPAYVPTEPATITVATPPQTSPPRPRSTAPRRVSNDELAAAAAAAAVRPRYASPATSLDSPSTPESSHSMSTSPASTPSPRTPSSIEHAHAHIIAQASPAQPGSHMNATAALKAQHMVRALQAEPGAPAHFGIPTQGTPASEPVKPVKGATAQSAKTFLMPRARGAMDPFAFAAPISW